MISFILNDKPTRVDVDGSTPLLWVLRDTLGMTGTKFGCGEGQCGCCTVHVDGEATRSCVTGVEQVAGRRVTTIEGLGGRHPLQAAILEEQAPQCGYCISGQVMQAAALLEHNAHPTREQVHEAMRGNLCRCGCYQRLEKAVLRVAAGPPKRKRVAARQGGVR